MRPTFEVIPDPPASRSVPATQGPARASRGLAVALVGLAGLLAGAAPAVGQAAPAAGQATPDDPSPHSEARLIAETRWLRPGEPFAVGLLLSLDPEWHSYWKNPGDSGEPTSIAWRLPEGFAAGPIQWPVPERISFPPLVSYGYYDEVLLPVEITPPAGLAPGDTVRLAGRADWLVCIEDCFPAEAELALALPVRDAPPEPDPAAAKRFEEARARMPVADPRWSAEARATDAWIGLRAAPPEGFPADEVAELQFLAAENDVLDHAAEQRWDFDDGAFSIRLARSGFSAGVPDSLRGVLVLTGRDEDDALSASDAAAGRYAVELAAPVEIASSEGAAARAAELAADAAPGSDDSDAGSATTLGLGLALLFAFLGGLILNLMPCVFPVLGLKVLGFAAHANGDRRGAVRQGAAFAAGVLVSFWVLGALLLVLRAAGEGVGWGFQLQSPLFVGAMAALFFLLALVLLGVLEIGVGLTRLGSVGTAKPASGHPTAAKRVVGSFGAGVLATIVATPCTAPFMGAALGWALVRPAAETMLVFTALGAGMAAPYAALSLAPGLVERLPAPGRWMETLKQALAFPLLATVIWLAWVFGLQTGIDGLTGLLAALLALGLAAWIAGRWGGLAAAPGRRLVARAAAVAVGVSAVFLLVRAAAFAPDGPVRADDRAVAAADWLPWSEAAEAEARADGAPLFLDFTAAWCLSCQVNERVVLNRADVREAFARHGVTLMKADWTRRDPAVTDALAELGRSSVPVYALYPRGGGDPVLLPSVLTKEIVLDALAAHAPAPDPDGG